MQEEGTQRARARAQERARFARVCDSLLHTETEDDNVAADDDGLAIVRGRREKISNSEGGKNGVARRSTNASLAFLCPR